MNRFSEFRADATAGDTPGSISGFAVPLDTEIVQGPIRHVIRPGAFAAQMKDPARVLILWNHDAAQPIGKITGLDEDGGRVRFTGRITEAVRAGAEALALIREDILDEVSVGFEWGRWEETPMADGTTRVVHTRARLKEISVVPFGAAGQQATIQTAAAVTGPTVAEWRAILDRPAPGRTLNV